MLSFRLGLILPRMLISLSQSILEGVIFKSGGFSLCVTFLFSKLYSSNFFLPPILLNIAEYASNITGNRSELLRSAPQVLFGDSMNGTPQGILVFMMSFEECKSVAPSDWVVTVGRGHNSSTNGYTVTTSNRCLGLQKSMLFMLPYLRLLVCCPIGLLVFDSLWRASFLCLWFLARSSLRTWLDWIILLNW